MSGMNKEKKKLKIVFNSPVVLIFVGICLAALILDKITFGVANTLLFSVYRSSLLNPLTYIRMFSHVFGHASFSHFVGNITMLLVIGPLLEEKYGPKDLIFVILSTAFVTGIVHYIFFPGSVLLGASGVVFAFIILSSVTGIKSGEIPITLILVAIIYIGGEIYDGIFVSDNVSQLTHIIGGIVGGFLGILGSQEKRN